MAKYEHLPIYKKAMELAVFMENNVKNMSRYNKYAIGAELRQRALKAISLVVRANSSYEKPNRRRDNVFAPAKYLPEKYYLTYSGCRINNQLDWELISKYIR